ncbi:MAG TPA: hypothetical protein VIL20_10610 [Sandaracinaceae bacterium]
MIAEVLKSDIERYAEAMPRHNALYVGALEGRITPEMASYYVFNVRHLVRQTQVHLQRARERALELGDAALAAHWGDKQIEERGHDRWADDDLERLRGCFGIEPNGEYSPALLEMIRRNEEIIERDPALYLAYALFAEYLVVLLGPSWLALLEERCGIPASMFSIVGKHADLDREHTSEGLEAIDALVTDPAKLGPMREVLRERFALFDRFAEDMLARAAHPEASSWTSSNA